MAKPEPKPKLSDAERLARFKDMAREVEASERTEDFDRAFESIIPAPAQKPGEHL